MQRIKTETKTEVKTGITEVWVTTGVKLSQNYNSIDHSIGMKAAVDPSEDAAVMVKHLQKKIEKMLKRKSVDMREFLEQAAVLNRRS